MSIIGKHRGWLLVYELQFWIILILSVLGTAFVNPTGSLFFLAFWGALIWSLYGSTDLVRRVHIAFTWIVATGTLVTVLANPSDATYDPARLGEYFGGALAAALWVAWAVYWHKSIRVRNSYPAPDQTQKK